MSCFFFVVIAVFQFFSLDSYVFDVIALGHALFDQGLRALLEDAHVVQQMHINMK